MKRWFTLVPSLRRLACCSWPSCRGATSHRRSFCACAQVHRLPCRDADAEVERILKVCAVQPAARCHAWSRGMRCSLLRDLLRVPLLPLELDSLPLQSEKNFYYVLKVKKDTPTGEIKINYYKLR